MKKIAALLLPLALMISTVSCAEKNTNSETVMQTEAETASTTTSEDITQTEPTTENDTKPTVEYYDGLICSDNMTDKEKERSSFREFTLIYPEKAFNIGGYRSTYNIPRGTASKEFKNIKEIENSFRELRLYDEELDINFLVHIILPPNYDEDREYPVFLITDAQYWLINVPDMWQLISKGEASPVIFVTLGHDYDSNGENDPERFKEFAVNQKKLLDFITDNLMSVISLNFKTDNGRSVFFGHSLGGLFADYALCNSDKYEYQPFANYIIASPAVWTYHYDINVYDIENISDPHAYEREFDFFERNESMDKKVFICAGEKEIYKFNAPDLATIPEESKSLYERLNARGVNTELKIYEDGYHTNYVEDMLKDYLKQNFPPNDIT